MAPNDLKVIVHQVSNLCFWAFSSSRLILLLNQELWMDDFVQGWSNSRIKYFKISHWNTTSRWWRSQFIHWINQLHFFDPLHRFRWKLRTSTYLGLEPYLPVSKRRWCRELVIMKIRYLQSLLVCPSFFGDSSTKRTESLADGPD